MSKTTGPVLGSELRCPRPRLGYQDSVYTVGTENGGSPEVRGGIEGASMLKMLFSIVHGVNRHPVAMTVTVSVLNGAPS